MMNLWMNLVDTLPDVRYWSEVLCYTILTHLCDLEVKVTNFEILRLSFWLKCCATFLSRKQLRQVVGQTSISLVTLSCGS